MLLHVIFILYLLEHFQYHILQSSLTSNFSNSSTIIPLQKENNKLHNNPMQHTTTDQL